MRIKIRFVLLATTCGLIYVPRSDSAETLTKILRNIEIGLERLVLANCTENMELLLMNNQTVPPVTRKLLPYVKFIHYTDSKRLITIPFYEFYDTIMNSEHYHTERPMVIIMAGFNSSPYARNYQIMAENLRDSREANVFILEPGLIGNTEYMFAISSVPVVAEALSEILTKFHQSEIKHIHLIGYSLGSHTAAYAARNFEKLTGEKIDRITECDATRMCFDGEDPFLKELTPDDAKFVDVIHTGMDGYGLRSKRGHVDFYPNGGYIQPVCGNLPLCGHMVSTVYFGESAINDNFIAVECDDWETFLTGACANNTRVRMGYRLPATTRGNFYLKTANSPPFALGNRGIVKPAQG